MESVKLASGDNNSLTPRSIDEETIVMNNFDETKDKSHENMSKHEEITPEMIDENELKLKERIAQCRNIIESLKLELNEEKSKLQKESKSYEHATVSQTANPVASGYRDVSAISDNFLEELSITTNVYDACVDSKLSCDENLIEYEKQLQKYQNTLNMAQIEKKNAIRKQMLAKAYRLKLLEVENQCNIELLRVKQSLQCLEPLQMIANKWKTNTDEIIYDFNNFELIPRYPELIANSGSDINSIKDDFDNLPAVHTENSLKDDSTTSY